MTASTFLIPALVGATSDAATAADSFAIGGAINYIAGNTEGANTDFKIAGCLYIGEFLIDLAANEIKSEQNEARQRALDNRDAEQAFRIALAEYTLQEPFKNALKKLETKILEMHKAKEITSGEARQIIKATKTMLDAHYSAVETGQNFNEFELIKCKFAKDTFIPRLNGNKAWLNFKHNFEDIVLSMAFTSIIIISTAIIFSLTTLPPALALIPVGMGVLRYAASFFDKTPSFKAEVEEVNKHVRAPGQ